MNRRCIKLRIRIIGGIEMLTEEEKKFVSEREQLNRFWPLIAVLLILMLAGLFGWMLIKTPQLVNPYYLADQLKNNRIAPETVKILSLMCPVFAMFVFFLALVIILYGCSWMSMESRYIKIIRRISMAAEL